MKAFYRSGMLVVPLLSLFFVPGPAMAAAPQPGTGAASSPIASGAPSIGGCPLFPGDNIWNVRIDALPVHARSNDWVDSIGSGTGFHMDFGSGTWDGGPIGIPFNLVAGSHVSAFYPTFYYPGESDPGPYPIPASPLREWGSDHHILIVDTETCMLYEIYDASFAGGQWYGGSGAIWDLNSHALRPDGWTSSDAAGLPILPGLVRYDEIAAGQINHAIRFTASVTQQAYLWPARHFASDNTNPAVPPMGARFRLKASFAVTGFAPELQVILQAMKRYGIILADNGADWYVGGAPDARWNNDMLHELDVLTGADFEAVDASSLMIDPDSGQARVAELPPSPWVGSVMISSDRNVVAVGRPHVDNEIASYGGFPAGALSAYLPMLFKNAWGAYNSAFYVQNVHPAATANLVVDYFDSAGTLSCTAYDTVAPLASSGYWVPGQSCLPAGWVGGVVVTSDQPIVAIGRPHIGAEVMAYNGFSSGSLTSYLPMLFKDAFGGSYDSAFYVQNVDAANTANITISFYDSDGTLSCTKTDAVPRLASMGYWLPAESCLPADWVGGVVVTSDRPIVTIGRPHIDDQITTYNGFAAGTAASHVPMLFKGAFGGSYDSAFYIQNVNDTAAANLVITYYDSAGSLICTVNDTAAPLASRGYWVPGQSCLPDGWVGGAVVSSDQPIVAIGRPHIGGQVTTYNGFTSGSTSSYLPMLFKNAFGGSYDSAFYIQNTEASAAAVTIQFHDAGGALTCTRTDTIPALANLGLWLPNLECSP